MKKFTAISSALLVTLYTFAAMAEEAAAAGPADNQFSAQQWAAIGAGLAIGMGTLGGALGQGRVAVAALDGIARNPGASSKLSTPMILGLVLIESLVLYALLIAFFLQGKIPTPH